MLARTVVPILLMFSFAPGVVQISIEPIGRRSRAVIAAPVMSILGGTLLMAVLSTVGDYLWFEHGLPHTPIVGVLHGAILLMALGAFLGVRTGRPLRGAAGGVAAGVSGALGFYALAGLLGYWTAMIAAWMLMWMVLAFVSGWSAGPLPRSVDWLGRGALASAVSAIAFYAIAGTVWGRAPDAGRNYAWHLVAWTVAWLPGLAALLARKRGRE